MKNTTLHNPDVIIKDKRIVELDRIVAEVKESEEWEEVHMTILEVGIEKGKIEGFRLGIDKGAQLKLIKMVCRKLQKGKSPEVIADELDEEYSIIDPICRAAAETAPGYDYEKIYTLLN